MVKKILFITLSNIGDAILTLPSLDCLIAEFPQAEFTLISAPRPKQIFENNPAIHRLIVYDKHSRLREKIRLFLELRKEGFDLVVDLRNSLFGVSLAAWHKTSPFFIIPKNIKHMRDRHLYRVDCIVGRGQGLGLKGDSHKVKRNFLNSSLQDEEYINNILEENGIKDGDRLVVVAAGARSHTKRWAQERFAELISALAKESFKVVLVGDKDDAALNRCITEKLNHSILDLSAKTTLTQIAALFKRSGLLITNDSALLHLASYLDIPVLAIFGPTNEEKYAPWSNNATVVKKEIFCRPCQKAQCRFGSLACLGLIKAEEVLSRINRGQGPGRDDFKRILIVRTDRIGDVVLSTPVIRAIRDNFPNAYIAMMVSPCALDIVKDNPFLDEVIVYDKDNRHKNWFKSIGFAFGLKARRFDLAIVLHPANRAHITVFLAGIRRRIGFNRKCAILLTDRIKHKKQEAEKHELEYSLDLVRHLGIQPGDKKPFMFIKPQAIQWADKVLAEAGIKETDMLLALHPAASCPSKIWPAQRFALLADELTKKYGLKVLILAGPKDTDLAKQVAQNTRQPVLNFAGKTSVQQLAALLKRSRLFISNDSGPVHIACAVGTAVISIFGRNQKGLSPKRWGPVGPHDKVLHKEVGCYECLAHNCIKGFACLKAITVDDVIEAADSILT
jgi:heptosyltransferase-2